MRQNSPPDLNRRQALQAGCGLAAGLMSTAGLTDHSLAESADDSNKGIAEIRMKSMKLAELSQFYEQQLGLPTALESDELTVEAGSTRLIFSATAPSDDEPFYHYAFNIPENKIESALQWQKQRTPLLRKGKSEMVHFRTINAHSVYFNDPAGNIVEYIARHDLKNSAQGEFSQNDILYASEIGIVVDDVSQTAKAVNDSIGIKYTRGYRSQSFTPLGDQHAILIVVKRDRMWFPNKKQAAKVHPVEATLRGSQSGEIVNAELDYKVKVAP